ncbi:MAG: HNH endonuclease family protein [Chloroflexota bacterium]
MASGDLLDFGASSPQAGEGVRRCHDLKDTSAPEVEGGRAGIVIASSQDRLPLAATAERPNPSRARAFRAGALLDRRQRCPAGAAASGDRGLSTAPLARRFPHAWALWLASQARPETRDAHVNRLGNLTLVTQPLNSALSNVAWRSSDGQPHGKARRAEAAQPSAHQPESLLPRRVG